MAYLLRVLIALMIIALVLTVLAAMGISLVSLGHIQLAIPTFLFMIFVQALVMFYFIGVARMVENLHNILHSSQNQTQPQLHELFESPPEDLAPYLKKVRQYVYESTLGKRKVIPWTMLMLTLGTFAFLLGGAHDTGLVPRNVHVGVVYGFLMATGVGIFRQWYYLGKGHKLLRELKALFQIPNQQM
jgi:hypothetical protein